MRQVQRAAVLAFALMAGSPPSSRAAITVSFPIVSSGGGLATSASFSASVTLGQPFAGVAAGATLAIVSGLAPSVAGATVGAPPPSLPRVTRLSRIAPNPFGTRTSIAFDIAMPARTTIRVFDASGRLIRTLIERQLEPGRYDLEWDGVGHDGAPAMAGIYFCQFRSGATSETRRITLIH